MIFDTRNIRVAGCCLFVLAAGVEAAQADVVVAAGRAVSLMTMSSIDQACHSQGPVTVNVIDQPRGGFLEITQTTAYPNFNTLNTRSRCNTLKLPATRVVYQSTGDFLGIDFVTLELIFPEGGLRRVHVQVSVRPIALDRTAPGNGDANLAPPGAPDHPLPGPDATPTPPRPKPARRHAQARAHPPCKAPCVTGDKQTPSAHKEEKSKQPPSLLTPI